VICFLNVQDEMMNKYALGRFINEFLADMLAGISDAEAGFHKTSDSVKQKNPSAKVVIYSGHDSTLYSMLLAMGFKSGRHLLSSWKWLK
jgi:hypothetical protein